MEIPEEIKSLYRHFEFHTKEGRKNAKQFSGPFQKVFLEKDLEKEIKWFIGERIKIWKNKIQSKNKPYSSDVILQKYRFCNILREFDKQTIEFHKILNPIRDNFPLWLLNMFYFRMVASVETVKTLGLLTFSEKENKIFYEKFTNLSKPKFGVPYVFPISTILRTKYNTREKFISFYLSGVIFKIVDKIKAFKEESVVYALEEILKIFKFNHKFLWTEVLIDVAYQYPDYIDLYGKFPIGPGAINTFKNINSKVSGEKLAKILGDSNFGTGIFYNKKEIVLSAENWEGVGCEFRKYTNLKNGKGRKRKF